MNLCPYFQRVLSDSGEVRYMKFEHNAVECFVSFVKEAIFFVRA
jgi:hypothetical protein